MMKVQVWSNVDLEWRNPVFSVKHGGRRVKVWASFPRSGTESLVFIERITNEKMYVDVLKNNLRRSAAKLEILELFFFHQDIYLPLLANGYSSSALETISKKEFCWHTNTVPIVD